MFSQRFKKLQTVIETCEFTAERKIISQSQAIRLFHSFLLSVRNKSGMTYVIGNGGSAGIASHFAVDLLNACKVPSNTLYDSNILTCISNDYGYDEVFSRQLEIVMSENDLLIAISSSGQSSNIVKAIETAKKKKCPVITLSGFLSSNKIKNMGSLNFWLNVSDYGIVETGHFFLLHTIVDAWKLNFFSLNKLKDASFAT